MKETNCLVLQNLNFNYYVISHLTAFPFMHLNIVCVLLVCIRLSWSNFGSIPSLHTDEQFIRDMIWDNLWFTWLTNPYVLHNHFLGFQSTHSQCSHSPIYEWKMKKKTKSPVNSLRNTAKFSLLWRTCPLDSIHRVPKVIRATYLKLTI